MSSFAIYSDTDCGSTSVSNKFIDEYLADANAAQIKVYLYLLRMAGSETSVSDMADRFNYTEKDICRALKYWEKCQLLSLSYDMNGSVVGIRLIIPSAASVSAPAVPQPFVPITIQSVPSQTQNFSVRTFSPAVSSAPVQAQSSAETYVKPSYSLDDLKRFSEQEETAQLIFVAESYLGKTLSSADIKSLLFITDVLGFSTELIDYLLAYCVDKDKKSFRYIETVAINWAEQNITTPEEAKSTVGRYDKSVYAVMRALGKSSTPTDKEAEYVKKWKNEFGFTSDIILEACERSVMQTDKNRFAYADSILKSWREAGVISKKDISAADASFKKPKQRVQATETTFHQFGMKHNYDYDEIEKALLGQQ